MSMNAREIIIPYAPRKAFLPYHGRKERFAIIIAHRRAGKTVAEVNECIKKVLTVQRKFPPPQVAFVSPTLKQGRRNAWLYMKHYASVIPGARPKETEHIITFPNGGRLMLVGSDDPDALRGIYLDHVALDEYGDQSPRVWGEIIRPTLSDYGGSATFIGTPKGHNHFYRLLKQHENDPDWFVSILRASETGILPEAELELARKTMTKEQYLQEYECSFEAAVPGLIYAEEIHQAEKEGRITNVPYDPAARVFACWDLGIHDPTAIWIGQRVGQEFHWIDYYEAADVPLTAAVRWIKELPYHVDHHILPHDAEARENTTGKSRLQFLEAHGFDCVIVPKHNIWDGIHAVRVDFGKFWFDKERCELGLDALRMYRKEFDEKRGIFSNMPFHDWTSHAADALRYGVMGQNLIGFGNTKYKFRKRVVAV